MLIFEDRSRVVVEAADQLGIQGEGNRFRGQPVLDRLEGLGAGLAEVVHHAGGLLLEFLVLRFFRVEEAQRVLLESRAAFRAQLGQMRAIVIAEPFPIRRTADVVADAVEQQVDPTDIESAEPLPPENDGFDIEQRAGVADRFDAELTKFVEATALRPLRPKIRAQVIEAHRLRLQLHAGIEVGADDRRGPLRAQRQRSIAPILEREHLLAHDVGRLAHGAHKEVGGLEGRRLNPEIAKPLGEVFGRPRHRLPVGLIRGQQILGPAGTLRDRGHGFDRIANARREIDAAR